VYNIIRSASLDGSKQRAVVASVPHPAYVWNESRSDAWSSLALHLLDAPVTNARVALPPQTRE
jgi:hypothetical protein